jgi:hypothetical protein
MAGWLFADVLLAMFVVAIGSQVRPETPPISTPSVSSEDSSSSSSETGELEKDFKDITVTVSNREELLTASRSGSSDFELALQDNNDYVTLIENSREAAIVEVFSWVPSRNYSFATKTSEAVCRHLENVSDILPSDAQCISYFDGKLAKGTVKLRLFLWAEK